MALVITVGYSVQKDNEENKENSTIDNSTEPADINLIFLQMKWPINGKMHLIYFS